MSTHHRSYDDNPHTGRAQHWLMLVFCTTQIPTTSHDRNDELKQSTQNGGVYNQKLSCLSLVPWFHCSSHMCMLALNTGSKIDPSFELHQSLAPSHRMAKKQRFVSLSPWQRFSLAHAQFYIILQHGWFANFYSVIAGLFGILYDHRLLTQDSRR